LSIIRNGGFFLDVGCCLGQDVRKLVFDGVGDGARNIIGAELNSDFITLGYDLFKDKETAEFRMITANILDDVASLNASLAEFRGRLSVVQLGMILHLFTWEEQLAVFQNTIQLLKPEPGTLIIGQATGNLECGPSGRGHDPKRMTWRHNVESFEKLVKEVGDATGTNWKVTAELDKGLSVFDGKRSWDDPKTRRLLFEAERL
jgi:SAM-dependent methyltransferase